MFITRNITSYNLLSEDTACDPMLLYLSVFTLNIWTLGEHIKHLEDFPPFLQRQYFLWISVRTPRNKSPSGTKSTVPEENLLLTHHENMPM